jgi:hypothetical protein
MNNHNYFIKIIVKANNYIDSLLKKNLNKFNFFINNLLKKYLSKLSFLFEKDKLLKYLSIKRVFVVFIVLFFSIFSYFSAPYLYNSKKLVNNIKSQLLKNLNLDFNLSENYSYSIFPKPNFTFKESSFVNKVENLGEIKVYILSKNLIFPNRIKIKDIVFNKMNFHLNKENYNFFRELLINDFSKFTLTIKNSNIFYKNNENEVLFINKINQLKYFYDFKNLENIFSAENQIFNIPYKVKFRDDKYKKQIISDISFDHFNFKIENYHNYRNLEKNGIIKLIHKQRKSEASYNLNKGQFNFDYSDKSNNQNFKYNGFVNLKPFFSESLGNINKMSLEIFLNPNSILLQLFKTGILNSKNLNISNVLNVKKTSSLKDLINLVINFRIRDGLIDLNGTKFSLSDYVDIKISDSLLYTNENNLILDTQITININSSDEIYKNFQTPRKYRNEIKKIEFNLNYNFDRMTANLNNVKIDEIINEDVSKVLSEINFTINRIQNRIYIKKLLNQAFKNYSG